MYKYIFILLLIGTTLYGGEPDKNVHPGDKYYDVLYQHIKENGEIDTDYSYRPFIFLHDIVNDESKIGFCMFGLASSAVIIHLCVIDKSGNVRLIKDCSEKKYVLN